MSTSPSDDGFGDDLLLVGGDSRPQKEDVPHAYVKCCLSPQCADSSLSSVAGSAPEGPEGCTEVAEVAKQLTPCAHCTVPFCDSESCSVPLPGSAGQRLCLQCSGRVDLLNPAMVEHLRQYGRAQLQAILHGSEEEGSQCPQQQLTPQQQLAQMLLADRTRLLAVLRQWTPEERRSVWPRCNSFLDEDPRWLGPLFSHLLLYDCASNPKSVAEMTGSDDWSEDKINKITLGMLERAHDAHVNSPLHKNLYRAAFVVIQIFVQAVLGGNLVTVPWKAFQRALAMMKICPHEEFECLVDPLVASAIQLTMLPVRSYMAGYIFDLLRERCKGHGYLATKLLLSLRANDASERQLFALYKDLAEPEELLVSRFDRFQRFLLNGNHAVCTSEVWGREKAFPLPTHWRRAFGTTSTERGTTEGVTGSTTMRFCCEFDQEAPSEVAEEDASQRLENASKTWDEVGVLQKHDGAVLVEQTVANAMRLMEMLMLDSPEMKKLLERNGLDAGQVKATYRVVCVTSEDALVEMVPNSVSIRKAKTRPAVSVRCKRREPEGPRSLREFFVEARKEEQRRQLDNSKEPRSQMWEIILAWTSAISSVMSFMLHLGDRHDENVIVTTEGRYVHVDFAFVLGQRPTMQLHSPPVRVDYHEIWEAVGSEIVDQVFFPVVMAGYRALRGHGHLLCEVLTDLTKRLQFLDHQKVSPRQFAAKHLHTRLVPGITCDEQADRFIEGVVLHYRDDIGLQVHDTVRRFIHEGKASICTRSRTLSQHFSKFAPPVCGTCSAVLFYTGGRCEKCEQSFCQSHLGQHDCCKPDK